MIIDFDIENLDLKNVTYEDDVLRFNGYRLELWHDNPILDRLKDYCNLSADMFLCDSILINDKSHNNIAKTEEEIVMAIIPLLFENPQKALAVQQYTLASFDEIKEGHVTYNSEIVYTYAGDNITAYYEDELINFGKEYAYNDVENNLGDFLDERVIKSYFEFINITELNKLLNIEMKTNTVDTFKLIEEFNKVHDDLVDIIENNDLFDKEAYVDDRISNINDAIDELESFVTIVSKNKIYFENWKPVIVYLVDDLV